MGRIARLCLRCRICWWMARWQVFEPRTHRKRAHTTEASLPRIIREAFPCRTATLPYQIPGCRSFDTNRLQMTAACRRQVLGLASVARQERDRSQSTRCFRITRWLRPARCQRLRRPSVWEAQPSQARCRTAATQDHVAMVSTPLRHS